MEKSLWSGCRWRESLQLVVGGLIAVSFHNTGLVELCTWPDSFFLTSGQCCLFFHFIFAFPLLPKGVDSYQGTNGNSFPGASAAFSGTL